MNKKYGESDYGEKEVMKDIIIDDLEDLGDYLDTQQMVDNIKCYTVQDIKKLIKDKVLPPVIKKGKIKVRLEDYAEWYASVIDSIPKNGDDPDFYDGMHFN